MKLKPLRKTHRKNLSKSSSRPPRKKNPRRLRNKLKKITLILIPVSLFISAICLAVIFLLSGKTTNQAIISPLAISRDRNASLINSGENNLRSFLEKENISFKSLETLENSYYKIILTDDREILISAGKDLARELSSLQYILSRLTMEGREFVRLDLRYEKPIIVFK